MCCQELYPYSLVSRERREKGYHRERFSARDPQQIITISTSSKRYKTHFCACNSRTTSHNTCLASIFEICSSRGSHKVEHRARKSHYVRIIALQLLNMLFAGFISPTVRENPAVHFQLTLFCSANVTNQFVPSTLQFLTVKHVPTLPNVHVSQADMRQNPIARGIHDIAYSGTSSQGTQSSIVKPISASNLKRIHNLPLALTKV